MKRLLGIFNERVRRKAKRKGNKSWLSSLIFIASREELY
jgi:hypothetical protein